MFNPSPAPVFSIASLVFLIVDYSVLTMQNKQVNISMFLSCISAEFASKNDILVLHFNQKFLQVALFANLFSTSKTNVSLVYCFLLVFAVSIDVLFLYVKILLNLILFPCAYQKQLEAMLKNDTKFYFILFSIKKMPLNITSFYSRLILTGEMFVWICYLFCTMKTRIE